MEEKNERELIITKTARKMYIIIILIAVLVLAIIISLAYLSENPIKATNKDINIEAKINTYDLAVDLNILPNKNINDLVIELKYYDKEGNELLIQQKAIGTIEKNINIVTQIKITDLINSEILKIDAIKIEVIEGTISLFS